MCCRNDISVSSQQDEQGRKFLEPRSRKQGLGKWEGWLGSWYRDRRWFYDMECSDKLPEVELLDRLFMWAVLDQPALRASRWRCILLLCRDRIRETFLDFSRVWIKIERVWQHYHLKYGAEVLFYIEFFHRAVMLFSDATKDWSVAFVGRSPVDLDFYQLTSFQMKCMRNTFHRRRLAEINVN